MNEIAKRWRVLVVDDDLETLAAIGGLLKENGFRIHCALCPEDAAASLDAEAWDIAIFDVGAQGLRLAREARSKNIPCILLTEHAEVREVGGLGEVLLKPFMADDLIRCIEERRSACKDAEPACANLEDRASGARSCSRSAGNEDG